MKMKALVVEEKNKAVVREVEIPALKEDEILVKVAYCGVCGTDFAIYSGETSFVTEGLIRYPVRIGHEWSGVVSETGAAVTKFAEGDRVVSDSGVACRACPACERGDPAGCEDIKCIGTINCWDGSFAEYIVIPESHLYKIPDEMTLKTAALIEPASIAFAGVRKQKLGADTSVLVIGTGAIGMSAVALAKAMGAGKLAVVGRTDAKLALAESMGADLAVNIRSCDAAEEIMRFTQGKGADFILETSGAPDTVPLAIRCAAKRGSIALIGFYETLLDGIDVDRLVMNELTVTGVMGEFASAPEVLKIILEKNVRLDGLITGTVGFESVTQVFENAEKDRGTRIKTLIKIGDLED